MIKLIIFDWDGTLADSVNKIIQCKRFLAEQYQLSPPSEETIRSVLGLKFENAMRICFPDASPVTLQQLGEDFHRLMQQDNYQAALFPHVKKILRHLKKKYKLAIATSKARIELDKALSYNELQDTFDATYCSEEHAGKPLPAMLLNLMEKFKIRPNECLMIGDTTIDIEFARNAKVKTVGVTFGAHTPEQLNTMNPIALINDWMELPETLSGLEEELECY